MASRTLQLKHESFGELMRHTRCVVHRVTLAEFAKLLGLSVSRLSDIERGRGLITTEKAVEIAKLLNEDEVLFATVALRERVRKLSGNDILEVKVNYSSSFSE